MARLGPTLGPPWAPLGTTCAPWALVGWIQDWIRMPHWPGLLGGSEHGPMPHLSMVKAMERILNKVDTGRRDYLYRTILLAHLPLFPHVLAEQNRSLWALRALRSPRPRGLRGLQGSTGHCTRVSNCSYTKHRLRARLERKAVLVCDLMDVDTSKCSFSQRTLKTPWTPRTPIAP